MSLVQHVTAIEGFDLDGAKLPTTEDAERVSLLGDVVTAWRRGSYDPLAPVDAIVFHGQEQTPHIAAYKVSDARRAVQVATAIVACWLASGIVFGFAALKPVLIAEGVFRESCPIPHVLENQGGEEAEIPCAQQDLRLNLLFVVASITTNVSSLAAGAVLDRYGRRICWTLSGIFLAAGCVLMGYAFAIPEFDGYLVGNIFLGLGGTFLFVSSFQLANAFPRRSGVILALVTGAFDASAAVFLFYRMAYDASGGSFSPEKFFFGYLVVPVLLLVAEWTYMPPEAYHTTPELQQKIEKAQDKTRDVHVSDDEISNDEEVHLLRSTRAKRRLAKLDRIEAIVGDTEEREERVKQVEERHAISGVWGVLHGLPAHRQMLTPWFVLILLLTVLQMLRMNYFIATIRAQYRSMLGSEMEAEAINHFFDVALPIGGVVSTPFVGLLLNNASVATSFVILTGFIVAVGVLNCLPYTWAGYSTVVAFVVFRPLYYSAVSDYATKVFGFTTFGRIYGMLICLSGLVNFSQSGLDALTHGPLQGDPTLINVAMCVLGTVLGVTLSAFIATASKAAEDLKVEGEEGDERRALIEEE